MPQIIGSKDDDMLFEITVKGKKFFDSYCEFTEKYKDRVKWVKSSSDRSNLANIDRQCKKLQSNDAMRMDFEALLKTYHLRFQEITPKASTLYYEKSEEVEIPPAEAPKAETPKVQTEQPKIEAPKEQPKIEAPKAEPQKPKAIVGKPKPLIESFDSDAYLAHVRTQDRLIAEQSEAIKQLTKDIEKKGQQIQKLTSVAKEAVGIAKSKHVDPNEIEDIGRVLDETPQRSLPQTPKPQMNDSIDSLPSESASQQRMNDSTGSLPISFSKKKPPLARSLPTTPSDNDLEISPFELDSDNSHKQNVHAIINPLKSPSQTPAPAPAPKASTKAPPKIEAESPEIKPPAPKLGKPEIEFEGADLKDIARLKQGKLFTPSGKLNDANHVEYLKALSMNVLKPRKFPLDKLF